MTPAVVMTRTRERVSAGRALAPRTDLNPTKEGGRDG